MVHIAHDLSAIENGDIEGILTLILQRAVDSAVIVGHITQVTGPVVDHAHDFAGLQIHLGKLGGEGCVNVTQLVIHCNTLHVAGGIFAQIDRAQQLVNAGIKGCLVNTVGIAGAVDLRCLGAYQRTVRNEAKKHNESQDPSHDFCGHTVCPVDVVFHQNFSSF